MDGKNAKREINSDLFVLCTKEIDTQHEDSKQYHLELIVILFVYLINPSIDNSSVYCCTVDMANGLSCPDLFRKIV